MNISIIGGGPRGLSVAEAICKKLDGYHKPTTITIYDDYIVGAGRIWRPTQDSNLLMNTLARQVTMFSNGEELGKGLGYGPTLQTWLEQRDGIKLEDNFYARRKDYGEYLLFVLNQLIMNCPHPHNIITKKAFVSNIKRIGGQYALLMENGDSDFCDKIVICTGHAKNKTPAIELNSTNPDAKHFIIEGDSCEDQDISFIKPGEPVGILGMGLGFLDLISNFTESRGGRFERVDDKLIYHSSGNEPRMFAGSRSGLPIPARAVNQKFNSTQIFYFFNQELVNKLLSEQKPKDFYKEVWPYIFAEMEHVYYSTFIKVTDGEKKEKDFQQAHIALRDPHKPMPHELVHLFKLNRIEELDLAVLKNPFLGNKYDDIASFNDACVTYLKDDVLKARMGNLNNPQKAALDTMRDVRDLIRDVVEYDGLTESSLSDFIHRFSSLSAHLAAGPSIKRVEQVIALVDAGVLTIMGPDIKYEVNDSNESMRFGSDYVNNGFVNIKYLIDGRVPFPSLKSTGNTLLTNLLHDGILVSYTHPDGLNIIDGGISVDRTTYAVIGADNTINYNIFALGIPLENPKWFNQVGSATPGRISQFTKEAERIVNTIIESMEMEEDDVA